MPSSKLNKIDVAKANVSIKVLKVDNKSLSVSILKQIREKDFIDSSTHELNGTPWGYLTVVWPEIKSRHGLHILFESKGVLLRDIIPAPIKENHLISNVPNTWTFEDEIEKYGIKESVFRTNKIASLYKEAQLEYYRLCSNSRKGTIKPFSDDDYKVEMLLTKEERAQREEKAKKKKKEEEGFLKKASGKLSEAMQEYAQVYELLSSLDQLYI